MLGWWRRRKVKKERVSQSVGVCHMLSHMLVYKMEFEHVHEAFFASRIH